MKKIILLFVFFVEYYSSFAQNNTYNEFSGGIGKSQYMDTYYFPAGGYQTNYSLLYNLQKLRPNRKFSLSLFNIQLGYANMKRKVIASNFNIATHLFNLTLKKEWLYNPSVSLKKLDIYLGFNIALSGNYYMRTNNSLFLNKMTGMYYQFALSSGISQICKYSIKKIKIENHWTLPITLYGLFPEYQNYNYFDLNFLYKNTQFIFINNYFQFNNNFSIEYPLFKNSSLKLSYLFESYYSMVNEIIVKNIKHQLLVGLVFRK